MPIEFARVSKDGRLTLVICDESDHPSVAEVPTLWAYSCRTDLATARCDLRDREHTPTVDSIGFLSTRQDDDSSSNVLTQKQLEGVRGWARHKGLDGLVWTDLRANWHNPPRGFRDKVTQPLNEDNVILYLSSLEGDTLCKAERYIGFAPQQVDTPIRRRIEQQLGWHFVPEEARAGSTPIGLP
ncbi:MAG TPA: hypothetical protein VMW58_05080 [Anaerolineae bacterium]|nr:hypothetical protein [Anaerolineae bacterium]